MNELSYEEMLDLAGAGMKSDPGVVQQAVQAVQGRFGLGARSLR